MKDWEKLRRSNLCVRFTERPISILYWRQIYLPHAASMVSYITTIPSIRPLRSCHLLPCPTLTRHASTCKNLGQITFHLDTKVSRHYYQHTYSCNAFNTARLNLIFLLHTVVTPLAKHLRSPTCQLLPCVLYPNCPLNLCAYPQWQLWYGQISFSLHFPLAPRLFITKFQFIKRLFMLLWGNWIN